MLCQLSHASKLGARGRTRTYAELGLSQSPLPLGYTGVVPMGRFERPLSGFSVLFLCRLGYIGKAGGPPRIRTETKLFLRQLPLPCWDRDPWTTGGELNPVLPDLQSVSSPFRSRGLVG